MEKSYQEEANEIINQVAHTDEDIKKLCKLSWRISVEYAEACKVLWESNEA